MRRYMLALLAAFILVIGAYFLNKSSTEPPARRALPSFRDLKLH